MFKIKIMDFLDEDTTVPKNQNYALISVVEPNSNQKSNQCALKIKGVFESREEAEKHVQLCMKMDPTFDIYLVEMGKWLPIPPNNSEIEDEVHQNDTLNNLIKGYKEQQILSKQHFEERKREQINAMLEQNLLNKQDSNIDLSELEKDPPLKLTEEQLKDLKVNFGKPLTEEEFKQRNVDENSVMKC